MRLLSLFSFFEDFSFDIINQYSRYIYIFSFFFLIMDKFGIAPLIATLLLISFAVSLGVVVMNFGRAQVELEAECPLNIDMEFAVIGGADDICTTGSEVKFSVENSVNIKVQGLLVNIIGTDKAETFELPDAVIEKGGLYFGKVAFSGEVRQIKITPKIVLQGEEQICTEKALITERLKGC
jgi:hypothetical protein